MKNYVITIARGFGSGGKEIGNEVARRLGIQCYEKRILKMASEFSGLNEKLFFDIDWCTNSQSQSIGIRSTNKIPIRPLSSSFTR